jgi:phosphoribosylanthranilate isomerase
MMKVKICGIKRSEDGALAVRLGAWALGFVFYPKSPRFIDPAAAGRIMAELAAQGLKPALSFGVFVNAAEAQIRETVALSGIDTVQLHGDETVALAQALRDITLIKAFRLQSREQFRMVHEFAPYVAGFLYDAAVSGAYGGTGHQADWGLVHEAPRFQDKHFILSGGLCCDNVAAAVSATSPDAVDLSSSVETSPGIKDHDKLHKLFKVLGALNEKHT